MLHAGAGGTDWIALAHPFGFTSCDACDHKGRDLTDTGAPFLQLAKSQNHRMVEVARGLCGSSSPTPLPKQGHLEQIAQDLIQVHFEYLQRRRLHNLSGQPVLMLRHPQSEDSRSDGTSYASVCAHYPLSCHWAPLKRVWPHPPDTHPSDIYKYILGPLAAFSSSG